MTKQKNNITKKENKPFDYGFKHYKPKNYQERISFFLDPEQDKIIAQLIKNHPNLYKSKSHVIRCAINYFLKHKRKKGIEII